MNLKDITSIVKIASSGEMQNFIAKFQAELDALTKDRMALRQAFPQGYLHVNARMDTLERKLDSVLACLAQAPWSAKHDDNPTMEQTDAIRHEHINGTDHNPGSI